MNSSGDDKFERLSGKLERSIDNKRKALEERIARKIDRISDRIASRLSPEESQEQPENNISFNQESSSVSPHIHAKVNLYEGLDLKQIDDWFDKSFNVSKSFVGEDLLYPTIYCETLEEFFEPHVRHLSISTLQKKALMDTMIGDAEKMARRGGGIYGVNWPGDGCYLNGWLLSYPDTRNSKRALEDPTKIPIIVETLAHEKLGHGFLSEFTTLGTEMQQIQLWRYRVAENFEIKISDTPEAILLREKWETLFVNAMYAEEGFATWIESKVLGTMLDSSRKGYGTEEVVELIETLEANSIDSESKDFLKQVRNAADVFLNPQNYSSKEILVASVLMESAEPVLASAFSSRFGQIPRYVLGYILIENLEKHFGFALVPYALAVAYNVDYNLETISNTDLARIVRKEPTMNIHSRLLRLMKLPKITDGSLEQLLVSANQILGFALPANIRFEH